MRYLLFFLIVGVAAGQTQIDLHTQSKGVDFTGASSTRPVKTGSTLPTACSTGDLFLSTGGTTGAVLYACMSNAWTAQGGPSGSNGTVAVEAGGTAVGSRSAENFISGPGIFNVLSDDGRQINIQTGIDTASIGTLAADQSASDRFCVPTSANPVRYSCQLTPTLTSYSRGMLITWTPDISCTPGPMTLNVDTLGAKSIKQADGVTDLSSCVAGAMIALAYDGSLFRVLSGGTGATSSVDTSVILSRATDQSGVDKYCLSSSGSPTGYTCQVTPGLTNYTPGMAVIWAPDVSCSPGPVSLNIGGLGSRSIKQGDGTTNPASCPAGSLIPLAFDGASFRITGFGNQVSSGGGGTTGPATAISRGLFATAPACGSTAFEYLAINSTHMLICDGAGSGQWFLSGAPVTPASATTWTWANQTGATQTTQGGSVILIGTANAGVNVQALLSPVPVIPYSVTACVVGMYPPFNYAGGGMILTSGTTADSPNITMGAAVNPGAPGTVTVFKSPSLVSGGSQYSGYAFSPPLAPPGAQTCYTVSDNGIQRKFWFSADGITRILVLSVSDVDYISPDHIGVYVDSAFASQAVAMIVLSFTTVAESI